MSARRILVSIAAAAMSVFALFITFLPVPVAAASPAGAGASTVSVQLAPSQTIYLAAGSGDVIPTGGYGTAGPEADKISTVIENGAATVRNILFAVFLLIGVIGVLLRVFIHNPQLQMMGTRAIMGGIEGMLIAVLLPTILGAVAGMGSGVSG